MLLEITEAERWLILGGLCALPSKLAKLDKNMRDAILAGIGCSEAYEDAIAALQGKLAKEPETKWLLYDIDTNDVPHVSNSPDEAASVRDAFGLDNCIVRPFLTGRVEG